MTKSLEEKQRRCFVLIPSSGEFEDTFQFGIVEAANRHGYLCERLDAEIMSGSLLQQIIRRIASADLVIVDLSQANPNIYYELGIVHSLGVPTILLLRKSERIPFDIRDQHLIIYESISSLRATLSSFIGEISALPMPSLENSPVLEAVPLLDRVPKSELESARAELHSLKLNLRARDRELEALKASSAEGQQFSALRTEIATYLRSLTEDIVGKQVTDLALAKAEIERLKQENQRLLRFESEIRHLNEMVVVNPRWPARGIHVEDDLCFLLMPYKEPWSDDAWALIRNIILTCGMRCVRADEQDGNLVMDDIWDGICRARVVVADLTAKNPNVTYEVGLADVLGKDVVLLSQTPTDVPFDFLGVRLVPYENSISGVRRLSEELRKRLQRFRPPTKV
jgi:hypothetical protein